MANNISRLESARVKGLSPGRVLLVLTALTLLGLVLGRPRPYVHTLTFDHVAGLQAGDGVYLQGLRIGRVRELRLVGRRVEVVLEIDNHHRHALPADPHFLLWRDELHPGRRAIRVQPGGGEGLTWAPQPP